MALALKSLFVVALGVAIGLFATFLAVERGVGFGATRAGPWTGWPKSGSLEADPYTLAARARNGYTPLGLTEGLGFVARVDSAGAPLDSRCDYLVSGATPATRFWTLTVRTPEGRLVRTNADIHGLTSSEVVRDSSGGFVIDVAASARPGNWLPVAPGQPFALALRLYDTVVSAAANTLDAGMMPSIRRGRCA